MSTFNPTTAELGLVNQVFISADPRELGIITGDVAVKVFAGSKLPPAVLGEIWSIADKDNNGFLTRKGVAIALRLIGHAQKGEAVTEALVNRPGPLAQIDGISAPTPNSSSLPSSPPPQSPPPRASLHPPLTAEDKSKFLRLFLKCGPVNGLLSGDKARDVFIKSKLPFEKLSQIWTLADTQDRGSLDQTDFTIAMYLIQASMSGQLSSLPATLPPGLYEQAGGGRSSVVSHSTGNSLSLSPSLTGSFASSISGASGITATPLTSQNTGGSRPSLQPQMTGQNYRQSAIFPSQFTPNPLAALGASAFGNNASPAQVPWDVTQEEKARFDKFFDTLDIPKRGFIEGEVAVPFMLQSKLSGDVLAQVWDLADLNNDGHLTREGFAIAMHLIQGKLAGKEIPASLPPSLVPPSMRATLQGASAFAPPASSAPAPVPEPIRDLLWDDSPPASATAPQHTIPQFASQPANQSTPVMQHQGTGFIPQQNTGAFSARSPPSAPAADPFGASAFASSAQRDLFSDEEDSAAAAVPDNSVEIGNLQNQLNSTNKSLDHTKAERQNMEQTLAAQASQLSALQTQLSSAKAAFETETRLLDALRERYAKQTAEMQKAREELIHAESDLSGIRVEKAEVEGSIMRDKEDVRELQRKMKEAGDEIQQAKTAIEKAKKETKHQKGLLAIAKKQLATREAERAKALKELEDAQREAEEAAKEREAAEEELAKEPPALSTNGAASPTSLSSVLPGRVDTPAFAAAQPLPASPGITTPSSLSSPGGKSNNPFERLALSTGSRPASPFSAPNIDIFSAPTPQTGIVPATSPSGTVNNPDAVEHPETDVARSASPFMHTAGATAVGTQAEVPRAASPFMHVAEASTSTNGPSTAAPTTPEDDDPFGLDDAEDRHGSVTSAATTVEKGEVLLAQSEPVPTEEPFASPTSKPLQPSETKSEVAEGKKPEAASFDNQFPPIGAAIPGGFPGINEHTDLDSKLVEKEHDDSDSESDDESVFHDANARLSSFSAGKEEEKPKPDLASNGTATAPSDAFDDAFGLGEKSPKIGSEPAVTGLPPNTDFFSAFTPSEAAVQPSTNGAVPESAAPFDLPAAPTPAAGLSAFDEALGKMSTPASSTAPQFKLDSAFDDDFDFMAAKAAEPAAPFPVNTATQPMANGSTETSKAAPDFTQAFSLSPVQNGTTPQPASNKPLSFEDAFGSVSSRLSAAPSGGDHGISFEEAFGGKSLSFGEAGSLPTAPSNGQTAGEKPPFPNSAPFPVQSPPGSPTAPATTPASPSTIRSMRSTSPPPRVSSPKPRVSTGSSNEGGPSVKPPPQRHSKLSIRLPFGRKDKKKSKHEPPPMPPPQFLSPVQEPTGATTPSVEDDVEPVKQLCSMGFSRTQAIDALEKYGYDVQRALNSLLGAA